MSWKISHNAVVRYRDVTTQLAITRLTHRYVRGELPAVPRTIFSRDEYEIELTGKVFVHRGHQHPMFAELTGPHTYADNTLQYAYIEVQYDEDRRFDVKLLPHSVYTGPDTWSMRAQIIWPCPPIDFFNQDEWQVCMPVVSNETSIEPLGLSRERLDGSPRWDQPLYTRRIRTAEGTERWLT